MCRDGRQISITTLIERVQTSRTNQLVGPQTTTTAKSLLRILIGIIQQRLPSVTDATMKTGVFGRIFQGVTRTELTIFPSLVKSRSKVC